MEWRDSSIVFEFGPELLHEVFNRDDLVDPVGILSAENEAVIDIAHISIDESLRDTVSGIPSVTRG